MNNIDCDWERFLLDENIMPMENEITQELNSKTVPDCTDIYISTKTRIIYLNQPIELNELFWKVPILYYYEHKEGIIKKEIRFHSKTPEQLAEIQENLQNIQDYTEQIITHIDNPTGRIKFKDIRKVSIGYARKDILNLINKRKKITNAFFNCFVIIIRLFVDNIYKEFHVKIFNTGKLEIPGISSDPLFHILLNKIIDFLQPYTNIPLSYNKETIDTILMNSNFNCGFHIDCLAFYNILIKKYNISAIYEPELYPGIQCKIQPLHHQTNKKISILIFRPGSILLVGNCNDEQILMDIYEYLKEIFKAEYTNICCANQPNIIPPKRTKKTKTYMVDFGDEN